MRSLRAVALAALAVALGCADLKNMQLLSSALVQRYGTQPTVALNNGSHLRITFQNVPTGTFDPESVATFVKAHYPAADSLEDISIAYATTRTSGDLTVTRTEAPTTFRVHDLPSAASTAPPRER